MDMALMPDFAYSMIKRTIGLKTADKGYRDDNQSVCEHYDFLIKQSLSWGPSLPVALGMQVIQYPCCDD